MVIGNYQMVYPNLKEEKKLWKQGYGLVAGLDEAGRGPLAGPVVAAAVIFKKEIRGLKINDSKKLSEKQREDLFDILTRHKYVKWGIGIVSEKVIDRINILEATKMAMQKAIKNLDAGFLILDGNFSIKSDIPQKSVIRGDQKIVSVSAASVIAKVTRDRIMYEHHKRYPQYDFARHKGYPTKAHFASLQKFGPCKIHRKTFHNL